MRIAIQSISKSSGHLKRGVGVYVDNLIHSLRRIEDVQVIEFDDKDQIPEADIVHYPYFDLFKPTLPFFRKLPTVVTVHDVTPLIFPEAYPPGFLGKISFWYQRASLKGSQAIITVSQSSKKDIISDLGIRGQDIFPVYHGVDKVFHEIEDRGFLKQISAKYGLPIKFVVYVGDVNYNKNLLRICQSCVEARIDLFLIGKAFEDKNPGDHVELAAYKIFLKDFSSNPLIHVLGFVEKEDLAGIFNLATLFLFPSLYEGFGLPILEAQSCGLPVITANTSSLPEIAGEGAVFVNPYKVEEITAAIKATLTEREKRAELIKKGLDNVQRFSWSKCAKETLHAYQYALKK